MATKKRGLGKGLEALLSQRTTSEIEGNSSSDALKKLSVEQMQRGRYQPRSIMDKEALEELASSIKSQGLIQPIVVRPLKQKDKYEIVAGERRWRAAQIAGLHEVPVVIKDIPDQAAMCMSLIENIQREDLNPLEEATALARLLDEFDMTHEQAAEAVGRSRSSVSNLLRLLDLDPSVKNFIEERLLDMGHARALLSLEKNRQLEAAKQIIKSSLSVRAAEALVRRLQKGNTKPTQKKTDPNIKRLQQDLSEKIGATVAIDHKQGGKGKLTIQYHSVDELQGILDRIR